MSQFLYRKTSFNNNNLGNVDDANVILKNLSSGIKNGDLISEYLINNSKDNYKNVNYFEESFNSQLKLNDDHVNDIDIILKDLNVYEKFINDKKLTNDLRCLIENLKETNMQGIDKHAQKFLFHLTNEYDNDNNNAYLYAMHSQSKKSLIRYIIEKYSKRKWKEIKFLKLILWVNDEDEESLKMFTENIAKNMSFNEQIEEYDPSGICSLLYFTLGKKSTVLTLWKIAYGHRERDTTSKFLLKDFENSPEARLAASKNAFALLSKRRYEYAAAFFILAGKIRDAVMVCIKQCQDWQLGLLIAKLSKDNEFFEDILKTHALSYAIQTFDRGLIHCILWKLKNYNLAIKVLVGNLGEVLKELNFNNLHYDNKLINDFDLNYVNIFNQVKFIIGDEINSVVNEKEVVMECINYLIKNGCHSLALELSCNWKFVTKKPEKQINNLNNVDDNINDNIKDDGKDDQKDDQMGKTNIIASSKKQSSNHVQEFDMSAFGF